MRWIKKGILFKPDTSVWWQQRYGMLPTPYYFEERDIIRIFFSSACNDNFSRISFIDVEASDPSNVITSEKKIVLDLGESGCFDDCGLIPTSFNKVGDKYFLFYSGYQRHYRVPYSILSGIAQSENGDEFKRISRAPFLERTDMEMNIRSAPFIFFESGKYFMFYTAGTGWREISDGLFAGRLMPTYTLKYAISDDCIKWIFFDKPIFPLEENEFGISRPYIMKVVGGFQLYYSVRRVDKPYYIGYAFSSDLLNWTRKDDEIGISFSENGWDSEMLCYPAVISVRDKTFLFYNGNRNGETGFGYAELER